MARRPNRADPVAGLRRLLRELRGREGRGAQRHGSLLRIVEIALFRLPARQREIVRRYDLHGESAAEIQRALSISARQFFRDRRAALSLLQAYLPLDEWELRAGIEPHPESPRLVVSLRDAALARRAFGRSLAQIGSLDCLRVLRELASSVGEPSARADVLLELAETAAEYDDEPTARSAVGATTQILKDGAAIEPGLVDQLSGRLARARARLAETQPEASLHFSEAAALLRRAAARASNDTDTGAALAETLGDIALLDFTLGAFAQARAASCEAAHVIEAFALWTRPRALEILAMHVTLDACFSGRTAEAIAVVSSLLRRAVDSGWCATASRLGADLVGLNDVSGQYHEAIRWYREILPPLLDGARPGDRWSVTMEAAHAYTKTGRASEALAILGYVKPGAGCRRVGTPDWHGYVAAALERMGENAAALDEAQQALRGYTAHRSLRGIGDAHRVIAICRAKLGDLGAAREHIREAHRMVERYGTPYAFLRTLRVEAAILQSPTLKKEALEFRRVLYAT